MKKIIWRGPILSFLAALSFAGCESLQKIKPAPMPIPPPVSSKISAQDKKAAAALSEEKAEDSGVAELDPEDLPF